MMSVGVPAGTIRVAFAGKTFDLSGIVSGLPATIFLMPDAGTTFGGTVFSRGTV